MKILKIIGWLVIPYFMILFQWGKIGKAGRVIGTTWAVVALLVLLGNGQKNVPKSTEVASQKQTEQAKQVEQKKEPEAQEAKPKTIEEQVKQVIIDTAKDKTNTDKDRVIDLQINDHAGTEKQGDKIIIAKLNANENLSNNLTKGGILIESNKVFQNLFALPEIEEVVLMWHLPLTDVYGKTEDGVVLKVALSKETAGKIKWDSFNKDNYPKVAQQYWEHPAFKK